MKTIVLKVTREDGTLEFVSYDEKIVLQCQANALANNATLGSSSSDTSASTSSDGGSSGAASSNNSSANSTDTCSTTVAVGLYYNDVWEYDLNCTRLRSEAEGLWSTVARVNAVTSCFLMAR